jgi:hypothetical protein
MGCTKSQPEYIIDDAHNAPELAPFDVHIPPMKIDRLLHWRALSRHISVEHELKKEEPSRAKIKEDAEKLLLKIIDYLDKEDPISGPMKKNHSYIRITNKYIIYSPEYYARGMLNKCKIKDGFFTIDCSNLSHIYVSWKSIY